MSSWTKMQVEIPSSLVSQALAVAAAEKSYKVEVSYAFPDGARASFHGIPRTPLFFGHISVSLYGKSYNTPTGFHTFYVVHILITTCWVSSTCSKIGPAPIDPSRSLACY